MSSAASVWFGPPDRRLFGHVHRPDAAPRAAVVICPSMGQESAFTAFTLRQLALILSAQGFLVVRFDYDGVGDSAGDQDDPGRVSAWLDSVRHAVELARLHTDAPVVLLGMRLGALLGLQAATKIDGLHGLVLWDCPRSGTSYVREQRVRQNVALGTSEEETDSFTGLGLYLSKETLGDLAELKPRALLELPCEIALQVSRPGHRPLDPKVTTRSGAAATLLVDEEQDDLLLRQQLPLTTPAAILAWLTRSYPVDDTVGAAGEVRDLPEGVTTGELRLGAATERTVHLGPHRLFGILSEPDELRSHTTVIFVPEFHTPHVGLARVWTELARTWARTGIRSLRFDLSGCGESDARPGLPGHQTAILEHIEDLAEVRDEISPDDRGDVVLVGLCSGAYVAIESATREPVRGLVAINPSLSFITPERPASPQRRAVRLTRPALNRMFSRAATAYALHQVTSGQVSTPTLDTNFDWSRVLEGGYWQDHLYARHPRVPEWAWRTLNTVLLDRRTEHILGRLVRAGTRVLLVGGELDWEKLTHGSHRALLALTRDGGLELAHLPTLDHALMRPRVKATVASRLTAFLHDLLF